MEDLAGNCREGGLTTVSAGIVLFRRGLLGIEILLVHPGGPFWARKDDAAWSIPKGEIDPGEDLAAAARREFAEEVGAVPTGPLVPLGRFRAPGGKVIAAFALEGDFDADTLRSNTIEIEWPPRSGRKRTIPEVDRAAWVDLETAARKLHRGQVPILDALKTEIAGRLCTKEDGTGGVGAPVT